MKYLFFYDTSYYFCSIFNAAKLLRGKCLALFALLFIQLQCFSQTNWQKGFLVIDQDTLRGYINRKEWIRNPREFEFQKTKEGNISTSNYSLKRVSYFQVDSQVRYQRFVTLVSKDEVGLNNNTVPSARPTIDTIFLEILQKGKFVNLYRYRDEIKPRYLISEDEVSAQELIYQLYSNKGGQYVQNDAYKTQLSLLAAKVGATSNKLSWLLKKSTYTESSLIEVVIAINGQPQKDFKSDRTRGMMTLHIGVGLSINSLTYKDTGGFNVSSSPSNTPYLHVGLDYVNKLDVARLLLRLDLEIGSANFHTSAARYNQSYPQTIDYTFRQNNLSFIPQIIYNIYNKKNIKFYAGTGLRLNLSSYSDNLYTIATLYPGAPYVVQTPDFFKLNHIWFALQLQTGMVLNKRYELNFSYSAGLQTLNQNTGLWGETLNSLRLGVIYHFNRK